MPADVTGMADVTDLSDYVEALKRMVAVPGEFSNTFPNTTDDDLAASLADAVAEAQLDGFFATQAVDPNANTVTPALSPGGGALVVIYAAVRIIRSQLRNLQTTVRYKAGPVEYDVQRASNVLTTELAELDNRKQALLTQVLRAARAGQAVYVEDAYLIRARGYFPINYFGEFGYSFYGYELLGFEGPLLDPLA